MGEILLETTVRNIGVGGIKVKVSRGSDMFKRGLCEVVTSLLPNCILGVTLCLTGNVSPTYYCRTECM